MKLVERIKAYDYQYSFGRRWYLRTRIILLRVKCVIGWHNYMQGYSGCIWCWMCGKRFIDF